MFRRYTSFRNMPEPPIEPHEEELRVCYTCECCGDPIYEGDDYYRLIGYFFCAGCVEEAYCPEAHYED